MPRFSSLFLNGLMCYDVKKKKTKKDKQPFLSGIRLGNWSLGLGLHRARELELLRCFVYSLEGKQGLWWSNTSKASLLASWLRGSGGTWSICSVLIDIYILFSTHYLTSLGLGRGSGPERVNSMCFPEPCGELSHTVNETVARAGQEPAGARASPGRGPAMPGRFQRVQLCQVTCLLRKGASQARRLCD